MFESRIARVQAAGIRQHEHPRAKYRFILGARTLALRDAEEAPVNAHAHECHHSRLYSLNLPREDSLTRDHFRRAQFGRRPRRPRAQAGQGQIEFHQARIILARERVGHEPRRIEQPPERIAGAREMMTHLLGAKTWVDPDEQDSRPRFQDVAQFWHLPNIVTFIRFALDPPRGLP